MCDKTIYFYRQILLFLSLVPSSLKIQRKQFAGFYQWQCNDWSKIIARIFHWYSKYLRTGVSVTQNQASPLSAPPEYQCLTDYLWTEGAFGVRIMTVLDTKNSTNAIHIHIRFWWIKFPRMFSHYHKNNSWSATKNKSCMISKRYWAVLSRRMSEFPIWYESKQKLLSKVAVDFWGNLHCSKLPSSSLVQSSLL